MQIILSAQDISYLILSFWIHFDTFKLFCHICWHQPKFSIFMTYYHVLMQQNLTKILNLPYIRARLAAFKPWCTKCSKDIKVWEAQTGFQHPDAWFKSLLSNGFYENHRPPTHRPLNTYPPTHRPVTHQLKVAVHLKQK